MQWRSYPIALKKNLYTAISKLYKDEKILRKFEGQKFVVGLKNEVMRLILYLPEDDFIRLKENLMRNNLLDVFEEGSVPKKCFRIVNELARGLNPERKNKDIELLTQKNLTLIQLGYIFVHEGLLHGNL